MGERDGGPLFDSWRKLLGKNVTVKLADQVVTRGRLIAFDDGGEAKLVDDMGFIHYCWPALDVTEDEASE
jgi:hypothetical protein